MNINFPPSPINQSLSSNAIQKADQKDFENTYQLLKKVTEQYSKVPNWNNFTNLIKGHRTYLKIESNSEKDIHLITTSKKEERSSIEDIKKYVSRLLEKDFPEKEKKLLRNQLIIFEKRIIDSEPELKQEKIKNPIQKEELKKEDEVKHLNSIIKKNPKLDELEEKHLIKEDQDVNDQNIDNVKVNWDSNTKKDLCTIPDQLKKMGIESQDGKRLQQGNIDYLLTLDNRPCICKTFQSRDGRKVCLYEDRRSGEPIALVFRSKKGKYINNNIAVPAVPLKDDQYPSNLISCRDMASFQLRHRDSAWRDTLGDKKKMENDPWLSTHQFDLESYYQKGNDIYKFSLENIGQALYELTVNSENPKPAALLVTSNHMLTIELEKREDRGVLFKLYDPNDSVRPLRILLPSREHLKKLDISMLLNEEEIKAYFENQPFASMIRYDQPKNANGSWETTGVHTIAHQHLVENSTLEWNIKSLYISMMLNANDVGQVVHTILNSKMNDQMKVRYMRAEVSEQIPIIQVALTENSAQAVKEYVEAVLKYKGFSDEEKYYLLGGFEEGASPLYRAFIGEYTKAIMAFTEAVVTDPEFPSDYKVKLLQARDNREGNNKLRYGLLNTASDDLKKRFKDYISHSKLNDTDKDKILFPNNYKYIT